MSKHALLLGKTLDAMSYIDTIDHELVGIFAGLPVYHPLETIAGNAPNDLDFNCSPDQLVIGGGSGEHPAVIIQQLDCAVAYFMSDWFEQYNVEEWCRRFGRSPLPTTGWDTYLDPFITVSEDTLLHFAGWSVVHYHRFYVRCQSDVLWTPYQKGSSSFERWLITCVGEFVFYSMPELVSSFIANAPDGYERIQEAIYVNSVRVLHEGPLRSRAALQALIGPSPFIAPDQREQLQQAAHDAGPTRIRHYARPMGAG